MSGPPLLSLGKVAIGGLIGLEDMAAYLRDRVIEGSLLKGKGAALILDIGEEEVGADDVERCPELFRRLKAEVGLSLSDSPMCIGCGLAKPHKDMDWSDYYFVSVVLSSEPYIVRAEGPGGKEELEVSRGDVFALDPASMHSASAADPDSEAPWLLLMQWALARPYGRGWEERVGLPLREGALE